MGFIYVYLGEKLKAYENDGTVNMKYKDIVPTVFDLKGNYGVAINWSDGHFADIFPFSTLIKIAKDCSSTNK
jgi:DUF971 family protein